MRSNLLWLDEVNNLKSALYEMASEGKEIDKSKVEDTIFEMLVMAYAYGSIDANLSLDTEVVLDNKLLTDAVDKQIAGETAEQRIKKYLDADDLGSLVRVAESESHRMYNQGAMDTAVKAGAKTKTWVDVGDDRVRDTHEYISGMTVGINDEFYTYDGDHALMPGGFESAENNVNCRCWLVFNK